MVKVWGAHRITGEDMSIILLALRQKAANDRAVAKRHLDQGKIFQSRLYTEQAHQALVLAKQLVGA